MKQLTSRQIQVAVLMNQTQSSKEVATMLGVTSSRIAQILAEVREEGENNVQAYHRMTQSGQIKAIDEIQAREGL